MTEYGVFIPSKGRPENVPNMVSFDWGVIPTFVVPLEELTEYTKALPHDAQATFVGVHSEGVGWQRQACFDLARAQGLYCVQSDDDLVQLKLIQLGMEKPVVTPPVIVIKYMLAQMASIGAKLAGIAPTDNAFFSKKEVQTAHFCRGNLTILAPDADVAYDMHTFRCKEDYDVTAQVITRHGYVARCDFVLGSYRQRTNKGGVVAYRNDEMSEREAALLVQKWPNLIKPHATRRNEVTLKG